MKKIIILNILIFSFGIKIIYAQSGSWTSKTSMDVPRSLLSACSINGVIYAIGGSLDQSTSTSAVEAYDISTDSWTYMADLPGTLCGASACVVNDKIYVIGGSTSILGPGYVVDSVYEYNLVSNSWIRKTTKKSNIPTPLMAASTEVVNGKIYVIGGAPYGMNSAYNSVYEYNPATDTWTKKSNMPTARFLASATAVDGKIYVFGGTASLYTSSYSTVEVYDPSADKWAEKGDMPISRCTHTSSAVNGNIYIFSGGLKAGTIYNDVLEYNPTLDTWATRTSIPTPRVAPAACSVGRKIYIIGGMDIYNERLTTVEEYDPALDTTNIVSVRDDNNSTVPITLSLEQNYPNPFNPTTKIKFSITSVGTRRGVFVQLKVYGILGNEVAYLVNEEKPAGTYEVEFSAGSFGNGPNLASGIYFYQLKAGNYLETRKMILIK